MVDARGWAPHSVGMVRPGRLLAAPLAALALGAMVACTAPSTPPASAPPAGPSASAEPDRGGSGTVGSPTPGTTPLSYPSTANDYARSALTAWRSRDAVLLRALSADGNTIFTTLDGGNYNRVFSLYQCTGAAGSSICAFYNEVGDEVDLRLQNALLGHPHAVIDGQWHPITFPTDNKAYAQEAIVAWGGHNSAAVALLTGKTGDTAFAGVPAARRGDNWTYTHEEGATGHLLYVFIDPAGDSIIVSFLNEGFAPTPANRHGLIEVVYYEAHS
jgi:hypothetical protein